MITRKDWNSLDSKTRLKAASIVFYNYKLSDEFKEEISQEWHHNNDVWHDILFKSLYWSKDRKQIKVVVELEI